jgi:hypothetical protein
MAIQAGHAVILIIGYFSQMFIIHIRLVMFMAVDACKNCIIGGVGMAIGTIVPFSAVRS